MALALKAFWDVPTSRQRHPAPPLNQVFTLV
ncbi:hypothetical protein FBY03_101426 [Pseudomonas sp. SJZ079]|nr:hypothetical protein FBY03_101426 [Pseudomonas sp. SJZ079]